MSTKNNPGNYDCYANAGPDEEMFILLARDPDAPILIGLWVMLRMHRGEDPEKTSEALECAKRMQDQLRELGKKPTDLAELYEVMIRKQ